VNNLTLKQSRFVENYCDSGNGAEAARRAGYTEKSAKEMAYENLTKPHIQAALSVRLDQAGISEPRLLKILDEGLEVMAVKTATHEGKIADTREFIDYVTRQNT